MKRTIRLASEHDLDGLRGLDDVPSREDWLNKIACREVIVADQGPIVGVMRFEILWSTVPFLSFILVDGAHRRLGISRELLAFTEQELTRRGYVAMLSSSQTDEPHAQRWHLHMGFHTNGIIENIAEEGIGEVVFRKLLTPPDKAAPPATGATPSQPPSQPPNPAP